MKTKNRMKLSVCIIYNKGKNCFSFTYTHKCMHTCVCELGYDVKMSFLTMVTVKSI